MPLDASPQEKYDNLILTFFEDWQENPGKTFKTHNSRLQLHEFGFRNSVEFFYFTKALISKGLLNGIGTKLGPHGVMPEIEISFDGINYCLSLLESGKNSTRCFIAMAFGIEEMDTIYEEGIKKAIESNGFLSIRVDKEHTENEQTINDFIIANIKQSRFCIADLTYQRNGVYFEAGYALGRGLRVIYTCLREDHKNVHFDLKSMQTILYNTPEELRDALSLKIQAVILE